MQGPAWIGLLKRIPPEDHDCLVLQTTNGTELMLQRVIRLEADFLVALGRMAGSTDQGKVLVIPYDQLTYLSLSKKLADDEIEAVLGLSAAGTPAAKAELPTGSASEKTPPANRQPPAAASSQIPKSVADPHAPAEGGSKSTLKPNPKAAPPSKSVLLARLRQRLAEDNNKKPTKSPSREATGS